MHFTRQMKSMEVRHRARNVQGTEDKKLHYAAVTLDNDRKNYTPPKTVNKYTAYYRGNISGSLERRQINNNVAARSILEDETSYVTNAGETENI